MIRADTSFILDGVTSDLRVRYDGANDYTRAVLAVIRHRRTKKREGPPRCGNGYETAYLPFAKGHVIALELGGSDDAYNVVPQFEDWQGKANGAWRQMEIQLSGATYAGHLMLVEVGYGRTGAEEDAATAIDAFQANRIRDWTDPRIPDSFKVRVWDSAASLAGIKTDADFDTLVRTLKTAVPKFTIDFDLGHAMPQPDRSMYVNQSALDLALARHEALSRSDSFVSFMLEGSALDEVRTDLAAMQGVTPTEATGQQIFPIIFAYQAGITEPKVRKKVVLRRKQALPTARDEDIYTRKRKADDDEGPAKKKQKTT